LDLQTQVWTNIYLTQQQDNSLRYSVLSSLDERFDRYLALSDNLRTLFLALNDEHFSIRKMVIIIIGRLSTKNPAYALPELRKTLLQLLTELGM
jgi:FKBP12-rapamycin complex-associated protein